MKDFIFKNILAIFALLVAIGMPFISAYIQQNSYFSKTTKIYYFANSYDGVDGKTENLKTADCWMHSIISGRSDAFRCVSEHLLLDPCFIDPFNGSVVACPNDPYSKSQFYKTNIDYEDKQLLNSSTTNPWYIKLSSNVECRFVTGATSLVADMRQDYICDGGSETNNFLLLPLINDESSLKIPCAKDGKIEECTIREIWY